MDEVEELKVGNKSSSTLKAQFCEEYEDRSVYYSKLKS